MPPTSRPYQNISSHILHINDSPSKHCVSLLFLENVFRYLIIGQKEGIIPSQLPCLLLTCANNVVVTAFLSSWITFFYFLFNTRNVNMFIQNGGF